MTGFMLAIFIAALICLAFQSSKLIGVAILALVFVVVFWIYPMAFLALFVAGGVALCCTVYFNLKGVRQNGQLSLPDKSERSD